LKKTLLCIGAGKSQYPVILKAKELGYAVIAIDQNPSALGFKIADERVVLSTYDAPPLLDPINALSNKYNIIGILNRSSGPPVVTAARLAKLLQLPYYSEDLAKKIVNKHLVMELCVKYGIPAPKSYAISKYEELNINKIQYPCVVRPSLSLVGKSGITIINEENELDNALVYAFDTTINGYVTIDEYIKGDDVSLVSFVDGGELIPLCLLDEINTNDTNGKISGLGFAIPSIHDSSIVNKQVILSAKKIVDTFEIKRSSLMVSFRIDKNQTPWLIEIHLDMGGDLLIEKLFPKALNYSFLEFTIKLLAGENPAIPVVKINPTAIIFDKGDDLVTDKKNTTFQAKDRMELDTLIYSSLAQ
jgi:carbamoylphosphate synthase large subunit